MQRNRLGLVFLILCVLLNAGCLFRHRKVEVRLSKVPLLTADQSELIAKINQHAAALRSLSATVDIDTTAGGEKTGGKLTDYQEIRGYILLQKPGQLRMIGLLPIVRAKGFDMVSSGDRFQLLIPPKNRLITGPSESTVESKNALENLRPPIIFNALAMPAIDTANEIAVLEQGRQQVSNERHQLVYQSNYHIDILRRHGDAWRLDRKILFNRADLTPYRQITYDEHGAVATDVSYAEFTDYDGVRFPSYIEIERPQEEYRIVLKVIKLSLNQHLTDEQFHLDVPPDTAVTELK